MKITFNEDEKSGTDVQGNSYEINGLVIRRPNGKEIFYPLEDSLTHAVIFKGLTSQCEVTNNKINIL